MEHQASMSDREWIHKLVDMIEDKVDLAMVKWLLQPYAERSLNRKYREETAHEKE